MNQNPRRFQSGFTLIEVMVVVSILAVLASMVVLKVMDRPDEARLVKAQQDIARLETALHVYRMDNFAYPSTDQGLEALVVSPQGQPEAPNWKRGGYVSRLPLDPWKRPYQYLQPGAHGEFDLFTLGADGREGGEGSNADIGNWNLEN